jgi:hypothetical protein
MKGVAKLGTSLRDDVPLQIAGDGHGERRTESGIH